MGYFKRFGDFCAAFGAFSAIMYLFCQYMAMDFKEIEGLREKLEYFFSNSPKKDYRFYLPLIAFFILSFVLSTCLHRHPEFTLAISVLPMLQAITMFDAEGLYERPMLYIVLSSVHICGCLFECIRRDREDGRMRSAFACNFLSLLISGFCLYILRISENIKDIDIQRSDIFKYKLWMLFEYDAPDMKLFIYAVVCFAVLALLSLIFRRLYYFDALLSLVPLIGSVYLWNSGRVDIFGATLVSLALIYAICRISVMLCCTSVHKEKQNREI